MPRYVYTYLVVIVIRKLRRHVSANQRAGLKGPCARNVAHCISTTAKDDDGDAEGLDKSHAVGMPSHAEIETAKPVARQAVAAALQNDSLGAVVGHDGGDDGLEDAFVGCVGDAVAERKVDGVVLAGADTDVAQLARAGEVFSVLVERTGHDAVGCVEGLFDAVAVVDVNVDVEHALLVAQKLDDAEHDVWSRESAWVQMRLLLGVPLT